ncbi:MAG TPA: ribonuclease H-like domain-containing protein [Actinomycetota bacterium]|nr:ribonuclease H-like domain-containing protein [Actinomycetota bacterium]
MQQETLAALDIETTGLDPQASRVLAVALSSSGVDTVLTDEDEARLLGLTEQAVRDLPEGVTLVTWNGEAFDLPFLRARFDLLSIATSLELDPTGLVGKYGQPRFQARWGGRRHVDIAYRYRTEAERLGVEWSLKPVAKALGLDVVEVDRRGEAIARLSEEQLSAYAASDARITAALAARAVPVSLPAVGQ